MGWSARCAPRPATLSRVETQGRSPVFVGRVARPRPCPSLRFACGTPTSPRISVISNRTHDSGSEAGSWRHGAPRLPLRRHQFGNWAHQLGDGRALTLGHVDTEAGPIEVQLKGAGRTPYSRRGDGRAVLRSSLREYLCSEAMHHLGADLAGLVLCTTGEDVRRDMALYDGRPAMEPGAIVARTAPSFVRFGSFQMLAADGDADALRALMQ